MKHCWQKITWALYVCKNCSCTKETIRLGNRFPYFYKTRYQKDKEISIKAPECTGVTQPS